MIYSGCRRKPFLLMLPAPLSFVLCKTRSQKARLTCTDQESFTQTSGFQQSFDFRRVDPGRPSAWWPPSPLRRSRSEIRAGVHLEVQSSFVLNPQMHIRSRRLDSSTLATICINADLKGNRPLIPQEASFKHVLTDSNRPRSSKRSLGLTLRAFNVLECLKLREQIMWMKAKYNIINTTTTFVP